MAERLLHFDQVTLKRSTSFSITGITFDIKKGRHLAVTGDAGSGKTTLLQGIAGILQPYKGSIAAGLFVDLNQTYHKAISFVPAKPNFRNLSNTTDLYYQQRYNSSDSDDALTVSEYLSGQHVRALSDGPWSIDKVCDLLHLTHLVNKQLIKLSNGESKRLTIAAGLIRQPALLLLDAPLIGLDVSTRAGFDDILHKIDESGITIVMTTGAHEIPAIIKRVVYLKDQKATAFTKEEFAFVTPNIADHTSFKMDLNGLIDKYPSRPMSMVLRMDNVNINYGSKKILQHVDWQILQGERWALSGPNGAGKSTLLSLINGDNPQAYANDIILFDRKRGTGESIWDIKRNTGYLSPELFQYFPPDTNCLYSIESGYYDTMGLFRRSDPLKAQQALKWMQALGIAHYAHQLLKNLPASAQRLCLLARAMIKCPTLLILDEPTQGMDDHQIADFKNLIDAICYATNITMIYVTHYRDHLPNCIDHFIEINEGKITHCL